jgi:hypothetical protein
MSTQTPEATATPTELAQLIYSGGLAVRRRVAHIETPSASANLVAVLDGIITAAQELRGVAAHLAGAAQPTDAEEPEPPVDAEEPEPLTGAWLEVTEGRTYGIGGVQ